MMLAFALLALGLEPENFARSVSLRATTCGPHVMEMPRMLWLPGLIVNPRGKEHPVIFVAPREGLEPSSRRIAAAGSAY